VADHGGLLEELQRRHVWRVAVAYAITGWLLVQIATQVFPFFDIPGWAVRLVVILIVIGFPVALVLAWVYEITPDGIRRTQPAESPQARAELQRRSIGQKLNAVIIAVLVLAVALLGWRLHASRASRAGKPEVVQQNPARTAPASTAAASSAPAPVKAAVPAKSVAVLPFENDSGQKDQQYFSDGLTADLINTLSQYQGLKVISRDSAFQFRDSKDSSAEIGKLLGVAHLLEGSVQRAGDEVRITATLVDAAKGSIVWSQRYDQPYTDLFKLQDAITDAVATALRTQLVTAPGAVLQTDRPPSGSLAAYTAYQQGNAYTAQNTETGNRKAIAASEQAIRLDPNYAASYAQLANLWNGLAIEFLSDPQQIAQAYAKARAAVTTALKLDPNSAAAHAMRSTLLASVDMDWIGAEAEARRALQLAPGSAGAKFNLGQALAMLGQVQQAVTLTRQALVVDPRNASRHLWLGIFLCGLGRLDEGATAVKRAIELQPGATGFHEQLAVIAILRGQPKTAVAAAQAEASGPWHDIALTLALQIGPDHKAADDALQSLSATQAKVAPYQIAEVYALRHDPDDMFKWLERAWTVRDPGISYLLYDPFILRYRADPRFTAFCKKVGLPTATDAVAMK
jgi:TolB-like protein/tetratricopeptide (TPR) repeat protein